MTSKQNRSTQILLVEDNPLDVELTLDAFREAQLDNNIFVAHNGQEALDYLYGEKPFDERKSYPLPNLILLDLKLPGIDGHEVLHRIKSTPSLKRLPVVILTSSQEDKDLAKSYDNGANSYLVKPISSSDFLEVIRQIDQYWLALNISPPQNDADVGG